jgi:hypothetical protein
MNTLNLVFSVTDYLNNDALKTRQLEKVSGGISESSGMGFGERDVQLCFKTKAAWQKGKKLIEEHFKKHDIDVVIE